MEIKRIVLIVFTVLLISCERTLDLAHKYDNTESSQEKETPAEPTDDLKYTEKGIFLVSEPVKVVVPNSVPHGQFMLDGKISVIKNKDSYTTIYSSAFSMWQDGCSTPWLEDNIAKLTDSNKFIGKGITSPINGFTDGGMWTIGVHSLAGSKIAAFFHAESHFPSGDCQYKSIGLAYSSDGGKTFDKGTKIISGPEPKPAVGEGGGKSYGLGDGCVVWNEEKKMWICYYSAYCEDPADFVITMAASTDPEGKPGTWKKWDGSNFTLEACDQNTGLGAKDIKIANLDTYHGGNPSVMYNTVLKAWVMSYHSWQRRLVISTSPDGISWEKPSIIVGIEDEKDGAMYPNFISLEGDLKSGKNFRLYYSANMKSGGSREIYYRKIKLKNE